MASRLRNGFGTKISFFSFQDIITAVTGILILVTLILTLYVEDAAPVSDRDRELKQQLSTAVEQLTRVTLENRERQTNLALLASSATPGQLQASIVELRERLGSQSNQLSRLRVDLVNREKDAAARGEKLGLNGLRERSDHLHRALDQQTATNETLVTEIKDLERVHDELTQKLERQKTEQRLWLIPDATPHGKKPVLITVTGTNLTCERFNQSASALRFPASEAEAGLRRSLGLWRADVDYLVFYVRPSGIGLFARCAEIARQTGFQVGFDAVEENTPLVFELPNGL